jgi:hypothetical protein
MALLTGLGNVAKNAATQLTLNKTELFALVPAGDFFKTQSNVDKCMVVYKATSGIQKKTLIFDLSQGSPVANLVLSDKARDVYTLSNIYLVDFDGGVFPVPATSIPSGLGIDLTAAPAPSYPYTITSYTSEVIGFADFQFTVQFTPSMALSGSTINETDINGTKGQELAVIQQGSSDAGWVGQVQPAIIAIFNGNTRLSEPNGGA